MAECGPKISVSGGIEAGPLCHVCFLVVLAWPEDVEE